VQLQLKESSGMQATSLVRLSAAELLNLAQNDGKFVIQNAKLIKELSGGQAALTKAATIHFDLTVESFHTFQDKPWAKEVLWDAFKAGRRPNLNSDIILAGIEPGIVVRSFSSMLPMLGAWDLNRYRDYYNKKSNHLEAHQLVRKLVDAYENSGDWRLQSFARQIKMPETKGVYLDNEIREESFRKFWDALTLDTRIDPNEAIALYQDNYKLYKKLIELPETAFRSAEARQSIIKSTAERFIDRLNWDHLLPEQVRFNSVSKFSSQELFQLAAYGQAELYPSSFQGLFNRMLNRMKEEGISGDELFYKAPQSIRIDFIKVATFYGVFEKFFNTVPSEEGRTRIISSLIRGISQEQTIVSQAAAASEIIQLNLPKNALKLLETTVLEEYSKAKLNGDKKAEVAYGLIASSFLQIKTPISAEMQNLGAEYNRRMRDNRIFDTNLLFEKGVSFQRHIFISDQDGIESFRNFIAESRKSDDWNIKNHGSYYHLSSKKGVRRIEIFANNPEFSSDSNVELSKELSLKKINPKVFIGRGHIYHFDQWMEYITQEAKLVVLGGCGGYSHLDELAKKVPDADVIATKGKGTKFVNDPLISSLNHQQLISTGSRPWVEVWKQITTQVGSNFDFSNYVSPEKNTAYRFIQTYYSLIKD
jgi:hypothetical protein